MGITWNRRPTDLDIASYARALRGGVAQVARESALAMEAAAKTNAPWQDDTGLARAGLVGDVLVDRDGLLITLSHSMDYGVYLELKLPGDVPPDELAGFTLEFLEAGRYAILWPTIEAELPQLQAALKRLVQG